MKRGVSKLSHRRGWEIIENGCLLSRLWGKAQSYMKENYMRKMMAPGAIRSSWGIRV